MVVHLHDRLLQSDLFLGARHVLEVDKLSGVEGAKLAAETLGSDEASLGDALWCCSNLFSDIKLRLSHKRLMIFTCRDDPHDGDATRDRQARTKADDLKETGRLKQTKQSVMRRLWNLMKFLDF